MAGNIQRVVRGAVAICLLAVACGGEPSGAGSSAQRSITVFAAASLTDSFEELGEQFETQTDTSVRFNFLSSADLATQIEQGAPADIFASADDLNMQKVVDAGETGGDPQTFAHNQLEIVVPKDNPAGVTGLSDFERSDLVISLCNEECPAGRYAQEVFEKAGLAVKPDSLEADVKGVVTRVALGEADAGICYRTDVVAAGFGVEGIEIPSDQNVTATYPIVTLRGASAGAEEFVELVLSDDGQEVLGSQGFGRK